jgi:hypothetical protein
MRSVAYTSIYLFCSSFKDFVRNFGYMASNKMVIVNDELETIWKEALWSNFKLQFQNSPGETEENLENPQSG